MIRPQRRLPFHRALLALALGLVAVVPSAPAGHAAQGRPAQPVQCHASPNASIEGVHGAMEVAVSCAVQAPGDGTLVVLATTNLRFKSRVYTARLGLSLNGVVDEATSHRVDVNEDTSNGHAASAGLTGAFPVKAGEQADIGLAFARASGGGVVQLDDPVIWALFVPTGSSYQLCAHSSPDPVWSSNDAYAVTASCRLEVSVPSRVLVLGSGTYRASQGGGNGSVRLGVDQDAGDPDTTRTFSAYEHLSGTDGSFLTQLVTDVAPGTRTASLHLNRPSGSGAVQAANQSLVAIAVPSTLDRLQICGVQRAASSSLTDTPLTETPRALGECAITAPRSGTALIAGSGTLAAGTQAVGAGQSTAMARLSVGTTVDGSDQTERMVSAATGGPYHDDRAPVASSWGTAVPAGPTSYFLSGKHAAGASGSVVDGRALATIYVADPDTATSLTITKAPTDSTATTATVVFTSDPDAVTTCRLDAGTAQPCAGGFTVSGLAVGPHTITVTATDDVGNQATRSVSWQVLAPPAEPRRRVEVKVVGTKVKVKAFAMLSTSSSKCPETARTTVRRGYKPLATKHLEVRPHTQDQVEGCRVRGVVRLDRKLPADRVVKVRITGKHLVTRVIKARRS